MKRYRSLFAVLLVLSVLLAGCGGTEEETAEAPEGKDVSLGVIAEGVYENEYIDACFVPGEDWTMLEASQLQDALADVSEMMEGTELEEQLEGLTQIMAMQAASADGLMNTNIVYTKMKTVERVANLALAEEDAMDAVLQQQEALADSYAAAGITVESMEKCPLTYRGEERIGIKTVGSAQGFPCYILQVYERTLGNYSVVVTMTSLMEDHTEEIALMYEKLS